MEIQSFTLDTGASPAVAAMRDAESDAAREVCAGMVPGRAAPDSVQKFTAAERREIAAIQNRENAEGYPILMRTPALPQQNGKSAAIQRKMVEAAHQRGLRVVEDRAHHHAPEFLRTEPLAICEHAHGYVVVIYDECDPDVEFGNPIARFGSVAECEAFIKGVGESK